MQIHLKTLGCRLNEAELETWAQRFQQRGHGIASDPENADMIVINSCAVTRDAARKSRQLIRRTHRSNPTAKLLVSGCYATLNQEEAEQLMGVDLVVANRDKDQLVAKALDELDPATMPAMSTEPGEFSLFSRGRQRAFVKVQDGCRYRCTFCIVTVARGDERSRPLREVIDEINHLHRQGVNEAIITGVHLGGYGTDCGLNLADLIKAILAETDIPRLRLGSLEPWELPADFYELFENPRLMPHLHLPLQSGSDSVLRRMARRCKTEEFSAIVQRLRSGIAHFNVTTDVIVGFPGETEREWRDSFDYIARTGFGHIHIFSYSRREGTKAATLPGQLGNTVKQQRSRQLQQLAETMKRDFFTANLGSEFDVLWESRTETAADGNQLIFGYTPNYLRVACAIDDPDTLANRITSATLTAACDQYLLARTHR